MKNLSRLFFVAVLIASFSTSNAQDKNNPWAITFGANAVDFYPVLHLEPTQLTFTQ